MGHANTRFHGLGESQRGKVIALGLYHQANCLPIMNIQRALLYQIRIDCGIKPAVVDDVVHMTVNIVVRPAGADFTKHRIGVARLWLGAQRFAMR